MITFRTFFLQERRIERPFVFTHGRYNPPTAGHIKHMQAVNDYAKSVGSDYVVYTSQTVDNKKNPLTPEEKITYIQQALPGINIAPAKNMFAVLEDIINKGKYNKVIYFAGSDYFEDPKEAKLFDQMKKYATASGITVEAMQSGMREKGISGTALRSAVKADDFQMFADASPQQVSIDSVKEIFNIIKGRLK